MLIPRKWYEVVISEVFHYNHLVFFGEQLDIEVISMNVKHKHYVATGPDTVIEPLLRDILVRRQDILVHERNLITVELHPANLLCFLPRLERLNISPVGRIVWEGRNGGHVLFNATRSVNIHRLHVLSCQAIALLGKAQAVPRGVASLTVRREFVLELLMMTSLSSIADYLAFFRWTGSAHYCLLILCVAEGCEGQMNFRVVQMQAHIRFNKRRWKIVAAEIDEEETSRYNAHAWTSLCHFNL